MSEEVIYPSMVIRSQAEAIELLEKENAQLKEENKRYRKLGFKHLNERNEKLESVLKEIREYIKDNISQEFRNGRNDEFYLELNEKELKILLEIIDKGIGEDNG